MKSYQRIRFVQFLFVLFLSVQAVFAQNAYFQQEVNYSIEVELDETNHLLIANETVHYQNNSSDTLYFLYFHLWPNGYRNTKTALARQFIRNNSTRFQFSPDSSKGWIDSLNFQDEMGPLSWEYDEEHIDICKITLRTPLAPGASTDLKTPFVVKVPGDFSRLGHRGQSYQISQWYPKPAVYDKDGWHQMPYLDQGEFYSEFGSFEVKITLPATYRVAATGILQEQEEITWLNELAKSDSLWKKDRVMKEDEDRIGKIKTITFKQDRVHDFAFFCDKSYIVRKDLAVLEDGSNVETWAFFLNRKNSPWFAGAAYTKRAVEAYSKWVGNYPYTAATAVEGALSAGGGMEYPMVTVISAGGDSLSLDNVITHEVGHNWFYGILGSNERMHAWMDEGFNSYVEGRYMNEYYPDRSFGSEVGLPDKAAKKLDHHWFDYISANFFASYGIQDEINTPSEELPTLQYGLLSYQRTAFLLNYLENYLGTELFDKCMHAYFDTWQFRHPGPTDVQAVFEKTSGKKLDWFFNTLFNTEKQGDYAITGIKKTEKGYQVRVSNRGQIAMPYPLYAVKNDTGIVAVIWQDGHEGSQWVDMPYPGISHVYLDKNYQTSDMNLANNRIKTKGIFKRAEPLKIGLLSGLQMNDKRRLNVLPAIGANTTDGLLLGLLIHNYNVMGKKFNFILAPMYGFGSEEFAGNFMMKYDWNIRDKKLDKIRLAGQYKRFADYDKLEPSLTFFYKSKPYNLFGPRHNVSNAISLSHAYINNRESIAGFAGTYNATRLQITSQVKDAMHSVKSHTSVAYIQGANGFQQFRIELEGERNDRITKKTRLVTRVYAGILFGEFNGYFSFYSASSQDVFKDYYLIDRAMNGKAGWLGSNQALTDQGDYTSGNIGYASSLYSGSVRYQFRWYFQPYLKGMYINETGYYETGVSVNVGVLQVFFPISSNFYTDYLPENGKEWGESIRFTFNYKLNRFWNRTDMKMLE